jgi:hypothetical protein
MRAFLVTAAPKANADLILTEDQQPKARIRRLEVEQAFATREDCKRPVASC